MILVYGARGQVARELRAIAPDARYLSRADADLSQPGVAASWVDKVRPDGVIIAAAHTAVDQAESEEKLAHRVNADAPSEIAKACAAAGVPLVYISTDYVFDGRGSEPIKASDETAPLNAYGRTKLAGEHAIRNSVATHAIMRTSWVFSRFGTNFVKTMLKLGSERSELSIVADQVGGPTPASAIAQACLTMLEAISRDPSLGGTYHFAGTPDVSWADFARAIFSAAELNVKVTDIPASQFPKPAARPANSRLDCSGLDRFGLQRPDWRVALDPIIKSELER